MKKRKTQLPSLRLQVLLLAKKAKEKKVWKKKA